MCGAPLKVGLYVAEGNSPDPRGVEGCPDLITRESFEFLDMAIVRHRAVDFSAAPRGRVKVDLGDALWKVAQESQQEVRRHGTRVCHPENKVIAPHA